jgi:hypothetical protein
MTRAVTKHLDNLIADKPTETYILASPPRDADEQDAFVKILSALRGIAGHEHWMAVDNIHMGTDGHIYFAKELLKLWAVDTAAP